MKWVFCVLMLVILCFAGAGSGANITTISVQEAMFSTDAGWNRTSETVTVGIPFAEDCGYTDMSQFGLSGVDAGQFRVLGSWANGNVKWVLVDFQTNLTAGEVKSVVLNDSGHGNFGGSNISSENTTHIKISADVANFTVCKTNFNIFDSVEVNGSEIVVAGNDGVIKAVDIDGVVYTSDNNVNRTTIIEENGPVRSVIKVDGELRNSTARLVDYTIRLTFYNNSSIVKGLVSLRNDKWEYATDSVNFVSAEMVVGTSIGAGKSVTVTNASDEIVKTLGASERAYVYQGHSNHPYIINYETQVTTWEPPIPKILNGAVWDLNTSFFGVEMKVGSDQISALGNADNWTQGYADMSDATGMGVTIGMRWMPQHYPAGFDMYGNGNVSIEMFSKRNNDTALELIWEKHSTREVVWGFHDIENNKSDVFHTLQHPLVARAPFDYYRDTGAFYNTDKLVTISEQNAWFSDMSATPPSMGDQSPSSNTGDAWRRFFRAWAWGAGGAINFLDTPIGDLLDWTRTNYSSYYVFAEQRTLFNAYAGCRHSSDFKHIGDDAFYNPVDQGMTGDFIDTEHHFLSGMPIYYFMSGNEYVKESYLDDIQWLHRRTTYGADGTKIPITWYFRSWSRQAQTLALGYEFTCQIGDCEDVYISDINTSFTYLIDSREDTDNIPNYAGSGGETLYRGRNMSRGYIYWDTTMDGSGSGQRVIWSFFHTQIFFDAAYRSMRVMKDTEYDYDRMEDFEDFLTGMSQFIYKEYIVCEDVVWGGRCGFEYAYRPYRNRTETLADAGYAPHKDIKPYSAARPYVWLHERMNESTLQDTANNASVFQTNARQPSDLQEQALMHYHTYANITPWQDVSFDVTNDSLGKYTLNWTIPANISRYQIKYSNKTIVDWLGYNRTPKEYTYHPSTYTPFFAAINVDDEPTPGTSGTYQEYVIQLDTIYDYEFAMKMEPGGSEPFPPSHTKAYYNPTSAIENVVNVSGYNFWNRTITDHDNECNFKMEILI